MFSRSVATLLMYVQIFSFQLYLFKNIKRVLSEKAEALLIQAVSYALSLLLPH